MPPSETVVVGDREIPSEIIEGAVVAGAIYFSEANGLCSCIIGAADELEGIV